MKNNSYHSAKAGFSLVEMLVTIAIIAILASIGAVGFSQAGDRVKYQKAETQLALLGTSLDTFKLDGGGDLADYGLDDTDLDANGYPLGDGTVSSTENLFTLLGGFSKTSGEIIDGVASTNADYLDPNGTNNSMVSNSSGAFRIVDPFGNPYLYRSGSDASAHNPDFDLWSTGKDGIDDDGAGDDIKNW